MSLSERETGDTRSDFQPIAERVHGEKMVRLSRNVLDLLAQLYDQLIEGAGGAVVFDAPDFVQERFARNGVAAFADTNYASRGAPARQRSEGKIRNY